MKAFLFAFVLALAANYVVSQSCHMREVDLCMAGLILQTQTGGLPVDEDEIKTTCEAFEEAYDCMGNYSSKCMTALQRELISLISDGPNALKEKFCQPSELRAKYLKHAPCVAEIFDGDDNKKCVRDIQAAIEVLPQLKYSQRLAGACCSYKRLKDCVHSKMEEKCGKESVDVGSQILELVLTDLPDKLCGSYDHKSQECAGLIPPEGTTPLGSKSKSSLSKLLAAYTGD